MFDPIKWAPIIDAAVSRSTRGGKDDLRQDLWVAVLEMRERIEASPEPEKFVERICRDRLAGRKTKKDDESLSDPAVFTEADKTPLDLIRDQIGTTAVANAVSQLPEIEKFVVRGMFYDDKTEEEVALELGRSVSEVSTLKQTALKTIQTLLIGDSCP